MAALENFLSKEEEDYFKTRGKSEGEISYPELEDTKQEVEPEVETNQSEVEKILVGESQEDNPEDDGDDDTANEKPEAATKLEGDAQSDKTKSQRDYEKAYKAQIHKQKELKAQLENQAKKTAEVEGNLAQLKDMLNKQAAPTAKPQPPEIIPDSEQDPLGYYNYKIKQLESTINQQNQYLTEKQQYEQIHSQRNAFVSWYKQSADEFTKTTPDFRNAYDFLAGAIIKERIEAGFTQQQANDLLVEDEMAIASLARRDGVNPAERIYNMAKNRGFTKGAAKSASTKTLDGIQKGMSNAKSLKSSGGEPRDAELGIDNIQGMSFAEFDEFWAKLKRKEKGR